jgi:hypothetical protein
LTSGIRYRLCSSELASSATRTYKARFYLAQGEILSHLPLSLSFDQEISLCLLAHPRATPDRLRTLGVRYTVTSQEEEGLGLHGNANVLKGGGGADVMIGRTKRRCLGTTKICGTKSRYRFPCNDSMSVSQHNWLAHTSKARSFPRRQSTNPPARCLHPLRIHA